MILHKSKPYRCIINLSFKLIHNNVQLSLVNEPTIKQAKPDSMVQLGNTLHCIIYTMAMNQRKKQPFKFVKLDINNGFWCTAVSNDDAWSFCCILPSTNKCTSIDDIELVVPNSLQMGWCKNPPVFCSGSETARDIISNILPNNLPPHKFEDIIMR